MAIYPSANELSLVRLYEAERIGLTGQSVRYFVLNRSVNVDPLYSEPYSNGNAWSYVEHNLVMAIEYVENDKRNVEAREEGFKIEFDAEALLAYNEWTNVVGANSTPKEGDVIECMNLQFDVVKVGSGGNLVGTPNTTGWKFELKRRSEFVSERRF